MESVGTPTSKLAPGPGRYVPTCTISQPPWARRRPSVSRCLRVRRHCGHARPLFSRGQAHMLAQQKPALRTATREHHRCRRPEARRRAGGPRARHFCHEWRWDVGIRTGMTYGFAMLRAPLHSGLRLRARDLTRRLGASPARSLSAEASRNRFSARKRGPTTKLCSGPPILGVETGQTSRIAGIPAHCILFSQRQTRR